MKISFFGSEPFSLTILKALISSKHQVVCVVSRADKKKGRGMEKAATVVADFAEEHSIPLLKPEKLSSPDFQEAHLAFAPDVTVVCSYGRILKESTLSCPIKGCINIHPSMLPKYRGATPIESALRAGDKMTGVSIFYMDEGCDTGDLILQKEFPISEEDNRQTLREKLADFSVPLILEALELIETGKVVRTPQPSDGASFCTLIGHEDLYIDWNSSKEELFNFVRAISPTPTARTHFRGKLIQIFGIRAFDTDRLGAPGEILAIDKKAGPVIAVRDGAVVITELKPEGHKLQSAAQFSCGCHPVLGEKFG